MAISEEFSLPERHGGCFFVWKNRIGAFYKETSALYKQDDDKYTWSRVVGNHAVLPFDCVLHEFGTSLIAIGGWEHKTPCRAVFSFDNKKGTSWSPVSQLLQDCCRPGVVEVKGHLVVLGGRGAGPRLLDDVQVLNGKTMQWSRCQPLPWASESPSVAVHNSTIFVAGGWCMGTSIWCTRFDELNKEENHLCWRILPNVPCIFSSLCIFDGSILVYGGYMRPRAPEKSSSVYVYDASNALEPWQHVQDISENVIVAIVLNRELILISEKKLMKIIPKVLSASGLSSDMAIQKSTKVPSTGDRIFADFISIMDFYHPTKADAMIKSLQSTSNSPILANVFIPLSKSLSPDERKHLSIPSLMSMETLMRVALHFSLLGKISYEWDHMCTEEHQVALFDQGPSEVFVHQAVWHFFTAMAIMELPIYDQLYLLTSPAMDRMVCIFYSGLACSSLSNHKFSTAKSIVPHMLNGIILQAQSNIIIGFLTVIHCLFQAQEPIFCKSFLEKNAQTLNTLKTDRKLSYSDVISLAYFVKHSGSSWMVEVQSLNYLNVLKDYSNVSISSNGVTSLQCMNSQLVNKKQPKPQSSNPRSLILSLCCETLSEVLYHVIIFFSPFPVLCTSRGPGYLSYVSCPCFKNVVLHNIHFAPIPATHWIPGDAKHWKVLQFMADQHTEVHGKELTEFVLLVSPLPWSITFTLPGSEEPVSINISRDYPYHIDEDAIAVNCEAKMQSKPHVSDELVAPVLPLQDLKL